MSAGMPAAPPAVIIDTNVVFDFFLGRDPDLPLLASLVPGKLVIKVPELVIFEFRGSVLKELGRKELALDQTRALASELDRADHWMSGVDALRNGCVAAREDIGRLRGRLDPFVASVRNLFEVVPHTPEIHYRGDLRFVQGLPPDEPKRGVQDCRIFEAALAIARANAATVRPARFFLTKDSDFLKKTGVRDELQAHGVELVGAAGPIYGRFAQRARPTPASRA